MAIPGSRGLFTTLWATLKTQKRGYIHLTKEFKFVFQDFKWFFKEIANKLISVAQLVPKTPNLHGYVDTCK